MVGQLAQGAPFFPGPPAERPRSGRRRLIIGLAIAGGSGLAVLVIVALVVMFENAASNCPPKDFPVYPGAQQTDFNYTVSPGSSDCSAGWEANAGAEQVTAFYGSAVSSGTWQLVSKDEQSGVWSFERRDNSSTVGMIRFLTHGEQTRIEMEVMTGQPPAAGQ
jgi:hypothetical protein